MSTLEHDMAGGDPIRRAAMDDATASNFRVHEERGDELAEARAILRDLAALSDRFETMETVGSILEVALALARRAAPWKDSKVRRA